MFSRDLKFSRLYKHPPDRVWRALTEREAIAKWLMENDFEPRVGHRFQFHTDPAPGFDGTVNCEVLSVDPPRFLSYSWQGGPIDTVLSFTLVPVAEGTRLEVKQAGFKGLKAVIVSLFLQRGIKSIYDQKLPAVLDSLDNAATPASTADDWHSPALDVAMKVAARLPDPKTKPEAKRPEPTKAPKEPDGS